MKVSGQSQSSGSTDSLKKSRFYALCFRGEQETSPDMVTGLLTMFSIDVYILLDSDTTLSFVTHITTKKFNSLPNIFY